MAEKKITIVKKTAEKEAKKSVTKTAAKRVLKKTKESEPKVDTKNAVEQAVIVAAPERKEKKVSLHLDVFDMAGKVSGKVVLPAEVFATKINPILMAQAVRVYLANQRQGTRSTKTRGEVAGSTRKIYRQKGTGRARHGGIRAPIFVKGGIAHGPKPIDYSLRMPKKMRQAALSSALSTKVKDNEVKVIEGLGTIEMKTKLVARVLKSLQLKNKILLVMPKHNEKIYKAARNISGLSIKSANQLHTYEVLEHKTLLFMKDAITAVEKTLGKEKEL